MLRIPSGLSLFVALVIFMAFFLWMPANLKRDDPLTPVSDTARLVPAQARTQSPDSAAEHFGVTIGRPDGPPRIQLAQVDPQGRAADVACSTCHSMREPNSLNRTPQDLDEFHQGMVFDHGKLTCYSCHNPSNSNTLRLADATAIEYRDVMDLCSQCHGTQATAFEHGAHGGMNGFWDLTRGPQQRNNCIDCHDPHSPSFPKMIPTFKPKDRFLSSSDQSAASGQH